MVSITLPDGSVKKFKSVTGRDIAESIGRRLAKESLAIEVDGKVRDLSEPIKKDANVRILTFADPEGVRVFRHSSAHLLAHAIKRLYPDAKPTIGPAVEEGFYYDFDDLHVSEDDFVKIEAEMQRIVKENYSIEKHVWTLNDVKKHFPKNPYKLELAKEFKEQGLEITAFSQGDFIDLCEGGHVPGTGYIKAFKLLKIAGAYWRGDQSNKQLTRIYGISFPSKKQLDEHLKMIEEAKKRDHRVLGQRLKLFTISPLVGAGLPLFQPNGALIRKVLEDYLWALHEGRGYVRVWTPHLAKQSLYETSGHASKFGDELFRVRGKEDGFFLKPMNCPHHMQIFADNYFSYRDMPVRYFEPATVYRDEKSGQLSGLTRVRCITQDDGHLFCRVSQIKGEVQTIVDIIKTFYDTLGMLGEYWVSLSVRGDDRSLYLGSDEVWDKAEKALQEAADAAKLPYKRIDGEAAFYGPKLDFMFRDCIGREWQLSTIQCDFNLPERFDLSFVNEQSEKERPVVIHRAILGSFERFIGILTEHFAGKFPMWLSPEHVRVLSVADRFIDGAEKLVAKLQKQGLRVTLDDSSESIPKKVRNAQQQYVNYIVVFGEKEQEGTQLQIRGRDSKVFSSSVDAFCKRVVKEVESKAL